MHPVRSNHLQSVAEVNLIRRDEDKDKETPAAYWNFQFHRKNGAEVTFRQEQHKLQQSDTFELFLYLFWFCYLTADPQIRHSSFRLVVIQMATTWCLYDGVNVAIFKTKANFRNIILAARWRTSWCRCGSFDLDSFNRIIMLIVPTARAVVTMVTVPL